MPRATSAASASPKKVPAKKAAAAATKKVTPVSATSPRPEGSPAKKAPAKKAPATKARRQEGSGQGGGRQEGPRQEGSGQGGGHQGPGQEGSGQGAARRPRLPAKKAAAPVKKAPAKRKLSAAELKFVESQRQILIQERATYLRQADSLKAEADSLAELREPGDVQFDEESGEGDTLAVERERDLALSYQARAAVDEIDHALAKIPLGTYGICEVSGQPIPRERLKAIPWAREKVEYKVGGFGRR